MRVFVTGANGFIGRHLVTRLRAQGDVEVLQGDLLDARAVAPAKDADVVYHLAAQSAPLKGESDAKGTVRTNVEGTIHLANAMRPGARLVFASTSHVYAPATTPRREDAPLAPISAYGATKLAAEFALQALSAGGPSVAVLRLFNVYGPGQSTSFVVGRLLDTLRRGDTPRLGASHPTRDFIYVTDVVDAMLRAGKADVKGIEVFNIGTGVGTTIRELAEATGRKVEFEGGARAADTDYLVADPAKARNALSWEPRIPLADGLRTALTPP